MAQGLPERAARLVGAAEGRREAIGVPPLAFERDSYDSTLVALGMALETGTLRTLREQGRTMTLEQATTYALEVPMPNPSNGGG